jgi:hypothetical protein
MELQQARRNGLPATAGQHRPLDLRLHRHRQCNQQAQLHTRIGPPRDGDLTHSYPDLVGDEFPATLCAGSGHIVGPDGSRIFDPQGFSGPRLCEPIAPGQLFEYAAADGIDHAIRGAVE